MSSFRKKCFDYDNTHNWVYVAFFCIVCLATFVLGSLMGPWACLVILAMIGFYGWVIWPKKEYFFDD
jgi:hypothetical protein